MSKEFQIRDGNLIASFDLENEDGDIDFCKLLKVSHGVADEIGMFVDYVATNKIIKDQSKQIADLEAKLAESEDQLTEEIEEKNGVRRALSACNRRNDEFADMIKKLESENEELKQQIAMQENTITNLIEDNRASQEWYKKQLEEKEKEIALLNAMISTLPEHDKELEEEYTQDKISFAVYFK